MRWFRQPVVLLTWLGAYPVEMKIVGVLAATHGPDDHAVFCSLDTAWVVHGLGHGHDDVQAADASVLLPSTDGSQVVSAALPMARQAYDTEVHFMAIGQNFHKRRVGFPRTAKAATLLRGQFIEPRGPVQLVVPALVIADLFATIAGVERWVQLGLGLALFATILVTILVLMQSFQQRRAEFSTMMHIGASRRRVLGIVCCELSLLARWRLVCLCWLGWLCGCCKVVFSCYGSK